MRKPISILVLLALFAVAGLTPAIAQEEEAPPQILITNVNVWDGTSSSLQNGMNVLITGNLVESISRSKPSAMGATVIDGGGRTLMPGLIDMHAHLCIQNGMLAFRDDYDQMTAGANTAHALLDYLDQGFTTARDTGLQRLEYRQGGQQRDVPRSSYLSEWWFYQPDRWARRHRLLQSASWRA